MRMFQISLTEEQYVELRRILNTNADVVESNVLNCEDSDLEYWESKQFLNAKLVEALEKASTYSI